MTLQPLINVLLKLFMFLFIFPIRIPRVRAKHCYISHSLFDVSKDGCVGGAALKYLQHSIRYTKDKKMLEKILRDSLSDSRVGGRGKDTRYRHQRIKEHTSTWQTGNNLSIFVLIHPEGIWKRGVQRWRVRCVGKGTIRGGPLTPITKEHNFPLAMTSVQTITCQSQEANDDFVLPAAPSFLPTQQPERHTPYMPLQFCPAGKDPYDLIQIITS